MNTIIHTIPIDDEEFKLLKKGHKNYIILEDTATYRRGDGVNITCNGVAYRMRITYVESYHVGLSFGSKIISMRKY